MPPKFPKRGLNRQFQAKTRKSIYRNYSSPELSQLSQLNISGTINPTNYRFEIEHWAQTTKCTSWVERHYRKANSTWLTAAILKIESRRIPIWRTFVFPSWKFVIYLFFYISTGLRYPDEIWFADSFDLLKRAMSPSPKSEVKFHRSGPHLADRYDV